MLLVLSSMVTSLLFILIAIEVSSGVDSVKLVEMDSGSTVPATQGFGVQIAKGLHVH